MINKENINSVTLIYDTAVEPAEKNSYKVIFDTDKFCYVPLAEDNTDYQAILTWIADGGTVIDNGGGE
tara:strand:- start:460 stop:663 length:204 start_codon:yes stop_codon:yes gene_type:complete